MHRFTLHRLWAMVLKEFIQMKRDRVTFAMMVGIPLMQLMLFGFAINSDPKHMPAALRTADNGPFARTLAWALKNSDYFRFVRETTDEAEAQRLLQLGEVQFVVDVPVDFTRKLLRGERPTVLIEADATDPAATGPALSAVRAIADNVFDRDLTGPLARLRAKPGPVDFEIHAHYNPENITQYNVVPGLMGVVLTMTMVVITGLAITRERERGTMENLLAMPVRPIEVLIAKIVPFIAIGYLQVLMILAVSSLLFQLPVHGSVSVLMLALGMFIASNLALGIWISTMARNQTQAVQMAQLLMMPFILLSGFIFPFQGMPIWAQWIGEAIPTTHAMRIVRGVLLKGNGGTDILPDLWPIAL
ncbi:MAG TPA: ABC transporter permease, partial [Opitutaceae bacterium]|nr:ABC transporter permease [Opitutaceae bacterium]